MDELQRHRLIQQLGQRAIDYYNDIGLCVFCDADDCLDVPHEEHCNVGTLLGVVVDAKRKTEKVRQRAMFARELLSGDDDER